MDKNSVYKQFFCLYTASTESLAIFQSLMDSVSVSAELESFSVQFRL